MILRPIINAIMAKLGNGNQIATATSSNIYSQNYNFDNVKILNPAGFISIPTANSHGFFMKSDESIYQRYLHGFFNVLDENAPTLQSGESMHFTNGWYIKNGNTSVNYISSDSKVNCTAANGEYVGELIINRITDLQSQVDYLTSLVSDLQSHTHTNGNNGSPTGAPIQTFTTPSNPPKASGDTTQINNGNYLIGANAKPVPSSFEQ